MAHEAEGYKLSSDTSVADRSPRFISPFFRCAKTECCAALQLASFTHAKDFAPVVSVLYCRSSGNGLNELVLNII